MTHPEWELSEERIWAREPRRRGDAVIIGIGALGGNLAVTLADLGFSPLYLVDRDILSAENLIRHPLGAQDIGQPKARALAARIRADSPWCDAVEEDTDFLELEEAQQVELLSRASFVVAATDSVECQRRINELCVRNRIAALYPGIWADETMRDGEVAALLHVVPGEGAPCFQCYSGWRRQVSETDARGGSGLDIKRFALDVGAALVGLFDPEDPHAGPFDPERTLTLIHSLSSVSPGIAHLFVPGNVRPLRIPFPREPCPVCGGQEPNPTSPGEESALQWLSSGIRRLVPEAVLEAYVPRVRLASWLLAMITALLISLRVESATGLTPRTTVAANIWNLGVFAVSLGAAFWPQRAADRSEPLRALAAASVAALLLFVVAVVWVVLPSSQPLPVQAAPSSSPPVRSSAQPTPKPKRTSRPLPEVASTTFGLSPVTAFSDDSGPAEDWDLNGGYTVSVSPSYQNYVVTVQVTVSYDPATSADYLAGDIAGSCMDVHGRTNAQNSFTGDGTYHELPLAAHLHDNDTGLVTGTISFAAVLPGQYSFDFMCIGNGSPDAPLSIGQITTASPGIATGDYSGTHGGNNDYSAMAVFSVRKSKRDTVIVFGQVGPIQTAQNPDAACLAPQGGKTVQPTAVSIDREGSGNGQEYKIGTLAFDVQAAALSGAQFFYNCPEGTGLGYVQLP
jgi:hypothetical protein